MRNISRLELLKEGLIANHNPSQGVGIRSGLIKDNIGKIVIGSGSERK